MLRPKRIILFQSWLATIGSLYYGRYGDPLKNFYSWQWFNAANGFTPCELCWFARILMYPILVLIIIWIRKKDEWVVDYILPLSGLGIVLEAYQYYFQMTNSNELVKAFMCNGVPGVSCAATDVIYGWFITIPFLCLAAFIVIFVSALVWKMRVQKGT